MNDSIDKFIEFTLKELRAMKENKKFKFNLEDFKPGEARCLYCHAYDEYVCKIYVSTEGFFLKMFQNGNELNKSRVFPHSEPAAQLFVIRESEKAIEAAYELVAKREGKAS